MKKLLTVLLLIGSMISQAQVDGVDVMADKYISSPEHTKAVAKKSDYNKQLDNLLSNNMKLREKFDDDLNRIFSKMFKDRADDMLDVINTNKDKSKREISHLLNQLVYDDYTSLMLLANKYRNSKSSNEKELGNLIIEAYTDLTTSSYCIGADIPNGDPNPNKSELDVKTIILNKEKLRFVNFKLFKHIDGTYNSQYDKYCYPIISKYR